MLVIPLSLSRTRAIVEHCLDVYLSARRGEATKSTSTTTSQHGARSAAKPNIEPPGHSDDHEPEPTVDTKSRSDPTHSPECPTPGRDRGMDPAVSASLEPPRLSSGRLGLPQRNNTNAGAADLSDNEGTMKTRLPCDAIFRPLENYLSSCLAGCATLNRSFLTIRPEFQRAASEGQSTRTVYKKSHPSLPQNGDALPEVQVDAKTLLLGDIAENSSWWTGERISRGHSTHAYGRERSPDPWRGVVSFKNARINWTEVASWYRSVLCVGESWRQKWSALQADSLLESSAADARAKGTPELLAEIENDLVNSRNRLQRVLLKATEDLLKRPGRPLKHPEDCRFLLIILANPLLLASDSSLLALRPSMHSSGRRAGPGQHSGIIKRVLGLMAYLPNEVQKCLVSWLSRFEEGQFQRTVDLVGGFVTYRLSRPSQRRELVNPTEGLVPSFSNSGAPHASQFHAALGGTRSTSRSTDSTSKPQLANYCDDWQVRAAARVMALLFAANGGHPSIKREALHDDLRSDSVGLTARHSAHAHGQLIPNSNFYNTMLDYADLGVDFENWESNRGRFSFCQYPFFLSIYAKIRLMDMEARRQMEMKAREAFFDSILSNKAVSQFLVLKVRRDCLVEDS